MKAKFKKLFEDWQKVVTSYGFSLAIICVLILGFYLRIDGAERIININLDDGGRDILVAKRMAEGLSPWLVAPDSAGIFPNTPIYYWFLAVAYKVGGGIYGVIGLHIMAGTGLIWICYLIGKLVGDKWTGLFLAVLAAFSPGLINAGQIVWQTHFPWFFVGLAIYVWLKAMISVKSNWHFYSLFTTFLMLSLHNGFIPIAGIMSLGLVINWLKPFGQKIAHQKNFIQVWIENKRFFTILIATWILWLVMTYGIVIFYDIETLSKLWTEVAPVGSDLDFLTRVTQLWQHLIHLFGLNPDFKINLMALSFFAASIMATILVVLKIEQSTRLEYLVRFLWLMVLTFVLGLIFSGGESFGWRVSAQSLILLILVGLTPDLLAPNKVVKLFFYLIILSVMLNHNWSFLRSHGRYSSYQGFEVSQKTAELIAADAAARGVSPTSFGLLIKKPGIETPPSQDLLADWNSASLQLALELKNPIYVQRVKIVPWPIFWSNYVQPDGEYFYLVCPEDGKNPICLSQITDINDFSVVKLEPIGVDYSQIYHLFFLTKKNFGRELIN